MSTAAAARCIRHHPRIAVEQGRAVPERGAHARKHALGSGPAGAHQHHHDQAAGCLAGLQPGPVRQRPGHPARRARCAA
eukprot:3030641-Pyramimonas_sp.AAC.1